MQVLAPIGVFAFAVSGALMAIGRDHDAVGIAILAVVTALGGGMLRDLALGDTPPPAFTRWQYLVVALAAAAVTSVAHPVAAPRRRRAGGPRASIVEPHDAVSAT